MTTVEEVRKITEAIKDMPMDEFVSRRKMLDLGLAEQYAELERQVLSGDEGKPEKEKPNEIVGEKTGSSLCGLPWRCFVPSS